MPGGKHGNSFYDDDDLDYDDDEESFAEYDEPVSAPDATQQGRMQAVAKMTSGRESGSSLARALHGQTSHSQVAKPGVPPATQRTSGKKQSDITRFDFSSPSPDDKVQAARQGPARVQPAPGPDLSSKSTARQAAKSFERMGISEPQPEASTTAPAPPLPLSEYRMEPELAAACAVGRQKGACRRLGLHLAVLGHVDAGKSTLMGRLLYELGHIDERSMSKQQRQATQAGKGSFAWAWLLDERSEERSRGVTIDVATAHFSTQQRDVTLLDSPGHRDFVPNMISGAARADAALLVVDGSIGGFESGFSAGGAGGGGQTREHAQLARCLGIEHLVVVITKLDTCGFQQGRFEEVKAVLQPFLQQCGFRESSMQWLPASALQGQNLRQAPTEPALAAWWRGCTLEQAIDRLPVGSAALDKPLRLPVTEIGRASRGGISISGKIEAGALQEDTQVLVMPACQPATVKSFKGNGDAAAAAQAGDSVDLILQGLPDIAAVGPGSVLCHPQWPVPLAAQLTARVAALDVPIPILTGQAVTMHVNIAQGPGRISSLVSIVNPKTGKISKNKPRAVMKGQTAVIEVTPAQPVCAELYADFRSLGRIVLRDGGQTLALGIITSLDT